MKKLLFLLQFIGTITLAQTNCNIPQLDQTIIFIGNGEVASITTSNEIYPLKLCYDYFDIYPKTSENIKYMWFESLITDTTTGDTLERSIKGFNRVRFQCNHVGIPAYLAYRLIFDPDFKMEAIKAVDYIRNKYYDKGLHVTFYFKNADSIITTLKRKFIYRYTENCDWITGINESIEKQEQLNFYPNPTQDGLLYFPNSINTPKTVKIFNSEGNNQTLNINNSTLDLSQLSPGLYTLQYYSGFKLINQKVIKQ
ncbi:MAG: T9SS type A sorting domain-containing protein [Opitutaceae bacterium]|nr:T9SS type A sorting domain-containing protein [Cytophagales bacterium]